MDPPLEMVKFHIIRLEASLLKTLLVQEWVKLDNHLDLQVFQGKA